MAAIQESGDLREHWRSEGTLIDGGFRRLTVEIEQTAAEQGPPATVSSKTAATRVIEHHQHHGVLLSLSVPISLSFFSGDSGKNDFEDGNGETDGDGVSSSSSLHRVAGDFKEIRSGSFVVVETTETHPTGSESGGRRRYLLPLFPFLVFVGVVQLGGKGVYPWGLSEGCTTGLLMVG
ncbi:hypothetical protein PIB30_032482 [Stylosanthes scabra]|uniref:Uncharacterized protein n=1 Tax=Stylosanthes scabra TaxID=79078 RepID=A0ABU6UFH1_9FABA|nr:hypothetical protein [Stylosanthes scabra]